MSAPASDASRRVLASPELLAEIFQYLLESVIEDPYDVQDLFSASLVCRAWWKPAQAAFWGPRRVTPEVDGMLDYDETFGWSALHRGYETCARKYNALHGSARLRKLVRKFGDRLDRPFVFMEVLERFPQLRKITLPCIERLTNYNFFEQEEMVKYPSLQTVGHLELFFAEPIRRYRPLRNWLAKLPNLTSLWVCCCGPRNALAVIAAIKAVKRLRRLRIEDNDPEATTRANPVVARILPTVPLHNLQHLEIEGLITLDVIAYLPDSLLSLKFHNITPRMVLAFLQQMMWPPRLLPKLIRPPELHVSYRTADQNFEEYLDAGECTPSMAEVEKDLEEAYAELERRGQGWSDRIRREIDCVGGLELWNPYKPSDWKNLDVARAHSWYSWQLWLENVEDRLS